MAITDQERQAVLACPMKQPNDAHVETVGDYLRRLLYLMWVEYEGFNGKRPFGNSGWKRDVWMALAAAGIVTGLTLDDDGYIEAFDSENESRAEGLILAVIEGLS